MRLGRKLRYGLIGTAIVAALGVGDYLLRGVNSIVPRVAEVVNPVGSLEGMAADGKISREEAGRFARIMDSNQMSEISFGTGDEEIQVVRSDSKELDKHYAQVSKEQAAFIKNNVSQIVFSPNVFVNHGSGRNSDVNGLSIGGGNIYVDTRADNGGKKNPLTYVSIMAHEAQHESDVGKGLSKLVSETRAFERESNVLNEQLTESRDLILRAALEKADGRVETGKYLQGLDGDFGNVYPNTVILAGDLLSGGVNLGSLKKYSERGWAKTTKGHELRLAARYASMVRELDKDKAITELHSIVTNPLLEGSVAQVSAASALRYLCPEVLQSESGADISTGRGININFGKSRRDESVGKGFVGDNSFSVSGTPSLNELLSGKRYDDFSPGSGKESETTTYTLADVDSMKIDHSGNVLFPDREGSPGEGFVRFYARGIDRDRNRRDDGFFVYYGTNRIVNSRGSILAKVDTHDGLGRYVESGVTWFVAPDKLVEIDGPGKLARKWSLENKPHLYHKD